MKRLLRGWKVCSTAVVAAALLAMPLQAATQYYRSTAAGGSGDDTFNGATSFNTQQDYLGAFGPYVNGNGIVFTGSAPGEVFNAKPVTSRNVGNITATYGQPNLWTNTAANGGSSLTVLTLTDPTPTIDAQTDSTIFFYVSLHSNNGLIKNGDGTVYLGGANNWNGGTVTLNGGITASNMNSGQQVFHTSGATGNWVLNGTAELRQGIANLLPLTTPNAQPVSPFVGHQSYGSLAGVAGTRIYGQANGNNQVAYIGALNVDSDFGGVIDNLRNNNTANGVAKFSIEKSGTGTQTFSGNNLYSGTTTINGGAILAAANGALGFGGRHGLNTTGGTFVNGAAAASSLKLANGVTVDEVITLNGDANGANLIVDSGSAVLNNGVADVVLTNAGTGGTGTDNAVAVNISGGGGSASGASGSGRRVTNMQKVGIVAAGTGYTSAPTVTLSGTATMPANAAATAVISAVTLTTDNNNIGGDGDLTIMSRIGGAGGFTKVGTGTTTLSGTNDYAGPTTVDAGLLKLLAVDADEEGSIASNVTVNVNGTLGGNGVVVGSVSGAGTVAPGNSIGTLGIAGTYNVTGTHDFEIASISNVLSNDLLNQITDLTYDGTLKVSLDNTSDPLSSFQIGDSWDLFDFATRIGASVFANDAVFGTQGDGTNLPILDPGMAWTFDYDAGVLAIEVPEPSTYALLSIGALGMLFARRLRK